MMGTAERTVIPDFELVERMAKFLDSKFKVPGTNFSFGLDPLIGLIPVLGDASTFIIQGFLAAYMVRYGASGKVAMKMFLNVLFDTILGSIPFIGWIGDFFFKANVRNIQLLKEHYLEGKHQGSGKGIVLGIIFMMFVLLILLIYATYKLFVWLYGFVF
jgi:hypothetical protein